MIIIVFCTFVMAGVVVIGVSFHVADSRRVAANQRAARRQFGQPLEPANVAIIPAQRSSFDAHCRDVPGLIDERGRQ